MGTNVNTLTSKKGKSKKALGVSMVDVLIALLPATVVGVYNYKAEALWIILTSILASVITEAVWQKLCKKKVTVNDLSAVVTGLIIALILPTYVPLWIPAAGSIFATLFVKQFFGGNGHNFMNPAVAAKVFLMTSWAAAMIAPAADAASGASGAEAVTAASGVAEAVTAASGAAEAVTSASGAVAQAGIDFAALWNTFLMKTSGNIGELSAAALLIGGLYLIVRRVISYKTPLSFILAHALMFWIIGGQAGTFTGDPITSSVSSVLMMAAFFMAGDPSSTPKSTVGQILFGAGCGVLGTVFKVYGYNGEGAYYAILIMNLFVPLLENLSTLLVKSAKGKEVAA